MIVGLRALEVEILDTEGKRVITHPRAYGDKPTDSGDPSSIGTSIPSTVRA